MPAVKGQQKTPGSGRKKGTTNKVTALVKDSVMAAFEELGGVEWLVMVAKENPTPFLTLLGKVLPTQITGDPENPVHLISEITRRIIKSD